MGGQYYPTQTRIPILGSVSGTTRTYVALPDAFYDFDATSTKIFAAGGYSKLELEVSYIAGLDETSNSIEISIDGSFDGTNFYNFVNDATSTGTSTLTAREFTFVQSVTHGLLGYDAEDAGFTVGLKVTGNGGATGYIETDTEIVADTSGTLLLSNVTGAFVNDEDITDSSSGDASVNKLLQSVTEFTLPIDISTKFIRVSVKETGISSNAGTVYMGGLLSGR